MEASTTKQKKMTEEDTFLALKRPDWYTMRDIYIQWKMDNFTIDFVLGAQREEFILQSQDFFKSYGWTRERFFNSTVG